MLGRGGFFHEGPLTDPFQVWWFHVPLTLVDVPSSWDTTKMQSIISSLEMLAQTDLLFVRPPSDSSVVVHQRCDNSPCVGAAGKGLSLKRPFVYSLQCLATLAFQRRLHVHLSHHAGERNDWADQISRLNERHAWFRSSLDPDKQILVSPSQLFSLSPDGLGV